ncbi:MAG: hypothetical protein WBM44_06140, partial [Waterburya sp.]
MNFTVICKAIACSQLQRAISKRSAAPSGRASQAQTAPSLNHLYNQAIAISKTTILNLDIIP